jgi:anti-sigma regulatory factor (Ser/Thr protein kinase)
MTATARRSAPRTAVARENTTRSTTTTSARFPRAATTPGFARNYVQDLFGTALPATHVKDIALLTSEVVTNAVESALAGEIRVAVTDDAAFTRIEVSNPGHDWGRGPQIGLRERDEAGGWGLFLVEQLSDHWGIRETDQVVWFEFDLTAAGDSSSPTARSGYGLSMDEIWAVLQQMRYPASRQELIDQATATGASAAIIARMEVLPGEQYQNAEEVSRDLVDGRAESNPALVAITAEVCEGCGFLRVPGEPHSCLEEKALFADSANAVSDEFEAIDERAHPDAG